MNRSDLKVLKRLINEFGEQVPVDPIRNHVLNHLNEPFFNHGGYHDLTILTTVKDCWDSLVKADATNSTTYLRSLLTLGIRWAYRADGMQDSPSKALYMYNSSMLFSAVVTALEGHQ
jgi:hypothetical protein